MIWIAIFVVPILVFIGSIVLCVIDMRRDRQLSEMERRRELEDFDD